MVEDDPAIARLLEALFASAGYLVQSAADGAAALAAYRARPPAAVLLDLTLPDMSGWEVLAAITADGAAAPVVLLTADGTAVGPARRAGAAATISKPFDIDEVLGVVERVVG